MWFSCLYPWIYNLSDFTMFCSQQMLRQTHAGKHITVYGCRTHMDCHVWTDSGCNTWDTEKNTTVSKFAQRKSPFCRNDETQENIFQAIAIDVIAVLACLEIPRG